MTTIFDAHSHIQYPAYDADRDAVIARARSTGVKMIVSGTQPPSSLAAIRLAEQYPDDIWATVGFHPNHAVQGISSTSLPTGQAGSENNYSLSEGTSRRATINWYHDKNEQHEDKPEVFDIEEYRKLGRNKKVVAIGECGLDYFRLQESNKAKNQPFDAAQGREIKERQKAIFVTQIELAKELKKPLVIHARPSKGTDDAYEDVLSILRTSNFQLPAVFHFYAGSLTMTKKLVDAGSCFTFGGVTTFGDDYNESIRAIPLERIMLETDAPYVAPVPYRGKRNEPAYVVETAKRIAVVKGLSYDDVARQTTQNVLIVFGITI